MASAVIERRVINRDAASVDLATFIPVELQELGDPQTAIPRIARTPELTQLIEAAVQQVPTTHRLNLGDARDMRLLATGSVHLVLTSPPYWTLKEYRDVDGQLGHVVDYDESLEGLDQVWQQCFDALVPGGRLICVVGDVCLSRRKNNGRHTVVPLHAAIQERCRVIGFDNLAPIIWNKIANAVYEVEGAGGFLGKPYEPNAVIKNDIEFILMQRKPGGYRTPDLAARILSVISEENHRQWFQQIWTGLTGHPPNGIPRPIRSNWRSVSRACLASWATQCSTRLPAPGRRAWQPPCGDATVLVSRSTKPISRTPQRDSRATPQDSSIRRLSPSTVAKKEQVRPAIKEGD